MSETKVPVRFVRNEDGSFDFGIDGSAKASRLTSTTTLHQSYTNELEVHA